MCVTSVRSIIFCSVYALPYMVIVLVSIFPLLFSRLHCTVIGTIGEPMSHSPEAILSRVSALRASSVGNNDVKSTSIPSISIFRFPLRERCLVDGTTNPSSTAKAFKTSLAFFASCPLG